MLHRNKDTFVRVRYWHEARAAQAPRPQGPMSNAGAGALCDAFNRLIFEVRPEWKNLALRIPVLLENLPPPHSRVVEPEHSTPVTSIGCRPIVNNQSAALDKAKNRGRPDPHDSASYEKGRQRLTPAKDVR